MVAVAVFALLAAIAVPSFRGFTAGQRLRAASFDLRADLVYARSEALKRNQNVTIRQRQDGGWEGGWLVVVDTAPDAPLRSRNGVGAGVMLVSPTDAITFGPNGRIAAPAGSVQIGLAAAAGSQELQRCLVLDPSGMPTTYAEVC